MGSTRSKWHSALLHRSAQLTHCLRATWTSKRWSPDARCLCFALFINPYALRYDFYRAHGVAYYWAAGTGLSTGIMGIAFAFIVIEYCTQSHLSTENYKDAMQGLKRTRQFKKYTAWLRDVPDFIINIIKRLWSKIWRRSTSYSEDLQAGRYGQGGRRSLLWTWTTKRQRGRSMGDGIIEGIPLHRQVSAEHSRGAESSKRSRSPNDTEMEAYTSPVSHEGEYPPDLPLQPVEIPLEEGRIRSSYRRI